MANPENEQHAGYDDGLYASAAVTRAERRNRRRKQALVGVAGLAAVLAGGSFFVTKAIDAKRVIMPDPQALRVTVPPPVTSGPATPGAGVRPAVPSAPARAGDAVRKSPTPPPPTTMSADERIAAALAAAGQPNGSAPPLRTMATGPVTVRNVTLAGGTSVRVVSARYDLRGQRELTWAADAGTAVGAARCTRNIRFGMGNGESPRPSMLICWRTSATRSVVTVAVNPDERPAQAETVAVLNRVWARLD